MKFIFKTTVYFTCHLANYDPLNSESVSFHSVVSKLGQNKLALQLNNMNKGHFIIIIKI